MDVSSSFPSLAGLRASLESDLGSLAVSAAGLGLLSHLSIFRTSFPVEDYLLGLLALYALAVLSTTTAYLALTQFSIAQTFFRVAWISSAFNIGLISSISAYRFFFHRLHSFPGPVWSKLTSFYSAYLAGKNVQYHVEVKKLHQEYGDFIRTGNPAHAFYLASGYISDILGVYRPTGALHRSKVRHTFSLWPTIQMPQVDFLCSCVNKPQAV